MQYTVEELNDILARHKRWIMKSEGWSEDDRADLSHANLHGADLRYADLRGANLSYTDLSYADLSYADLSGAGLGGAKGAELIRARTEIVPREGSFVGWKRVYNYGDVLCKLRITEDAKRSNATGRKCRASKVEVLELTRHGEPVESAHSAHDNRFIYEVGKVLEVADFDDDRMNECAPGIHFFLTPEEALDY